MHNFFLMASDSNTELETLRKQLQNAREEAERERRARKEADERERRAREEADERERRAREEAFEFIEKALQERRSQRTPSPSRQALDPHKQTPRSHSTSNLYNTSEARKYIDDALKAELQNSLILDHPKLTSLFFPTTDSAIAIFEACKQGEQPFFQDNAGWVGWPQTANESGVLNWFQGIFKHIRQLAADNGLITQGSRNILAAPDIPLDGHIAQRKLDIGLIDSAWMRTGCHPYHNKPSYKVSERYDWSQILVVGELKQNPKMDTSEGTWLDLSRYARVVFKEQDLRRYVLGFTLCGPQMRLWYFDRVGGVASPSFNINEDGQTFVSVLVGFLAMDERQFGYDPSIMTDEYGSFITITRDARKERVDLIRLIKRQSGIVGRATTCWEGLLNGIPVCVKDSWQYPERPDEGDLLKLVTERGAQNVARYYHHEIIEGIHENPRSWFADATGRHVFQSEARSASPAERLQSTTSSSRKRSHDSWDCLDSPQPPKKRSLLQLKHDVRNREHRRLITLDVGKDIRKASSRVALIQGVIGSISGLEQCTNAGVMHCDVSISNMMLYEDEHDGFLIDLDIAALIQRNKASGAPTKTGTKVFMSIGVLLGYHHSFMDDLESVFWALFWFCAHCTGPGQEKSTIHELEQWNYDGLRDLAYKKAGLVYLEGELERVLRKFVSDYYQPFIPWMIKLSKVVFPGGKQWRQEDKGLYARMKGVLREALEDVNVSKE